MVQVTLLVYADATPFQMGSRGVRGFPALSRNSVNDVASKPRTWVTSCMPVPIWWSNRQENRGPCASRCGGGESSGLHTATLHSHSLSHPRTKDVSWEDVAAARLAGTDDGHQLMRLQVAFQKVQ
jgi:hypothetical protein